MAMTQFVLQLLDVILKIPTVAGLAAQALTNASQGRA
jgi:hypothetical protein